MDGIGIQALSATTNPILDKSDAHHIILSK